MKYRALGKTGLQVSLLGFGGIPIQRISAVEAAKVIHTAIDGGINFIDTARGYTDSEEKIGQAIKGRRDKLVLASKSMVRTAEKMQADIELSLKLLGTDYLDLYQCHNIRTKEDLETVTGPGGALEALQAAQKAGKVRFIGVTGHKPSFLVDVLKTGVFATIQVPYNFIEQDAEKELLPYARTQGLGIICMKPLAGGAFSKPELALKFLAGQDVSSLIPGVDSAEQVEQNIRTLEDSQGLSAAELAYLQDEAQKVGQRFCRRCEYCKPCPHGVDVTNSFLFHAYFERYNMVEWPRQRYASLPVKADACQECGICEERCPYNLPVRKMLKQVHCDLG